MFTDVLRRSLNVLRISYDTLVALTGLVGHVGRSGVGGRFPVSLGYA